MTTAIKLARVVVAAMTAIFAPFVLSQATPNLTTPWDHPAAELADQIAGILGPGQVRLTIRNTSSISTDQIPAIRKLLEQDLKSHGITTSGTESASTIRITLSENARERLWVAEIGEGNEMHVAMVAVAPAIDVPSTAKAGMALRKEVFLSAFSINWHAFEPSKQPILSVVETTRGLVTLGQHEISFYAMSQAGWQPQQTIEINRATHLSRDPRGVLVATADGGGINAILPGVACSGSLLVSVSAANGGWTAHCNDSDDPWPLAQAPTTGSTIASIKAFYNPARDYFTGVVTPSVGVDLPPFYSAALLPRAGGGALLIGGIDGKVLLAENGAIKTVSGTRDWGSDFAALESGCGSGTQIVASASGEALSDSLRAYELPGQEALPASAPLSMDGTVTALSTAPGGKSVLAIVRHPNGEYEVDRVTALCN